MESRNISDPARVFISFPFFLYYLEVIMLQSSAIIKMHIREDV